MKSIENLSIGDYLGIFRRRIWYVIVTTILVSSVGVAYVWQMPSIYVSETTLLISGRLLPEDYIRSLDRLTTNERIDFVTRQLQSRSFLERVVLEFQLASPDVPIENAALAVKNSIQISPLSASALKLGFFATDPNLAQAVTRRLAEMVVQLDASTGKEKVQNADQFLEEQQRSAEGEMFEIEEKLLQFRNRHFSGLGLTDVTAEAIRDLEVETAAADTRLATAVEARIVLERRLEDTRQLKSMIGTMGTPPPAVVPSGSSSQPSTPVVSPFAQALANKRSELAQANTRYTAIHPEVQRISRELRELEALAAKAAVPERVTETAEVAVPVPQGSGENKPPLPGVDFTADLARAELQIELDRAKAEIVKAEQAKRTVSQKLFAYKTRMNPPIAVAQELATLERDHQAAQQRLKVLTDKKLNSQLAASVDSSADNEVFKVLDPAYLPRDPVRPNRQAYSLAACLAGLVAGLGLAFLREFLDPSLHNEADAAAELKLPILAGVPNLAFDKRVKAMTSPLRLGNIDDSDRFGLKTADSNIRDIILDPMSAAGEPYRLMHAKLSLMQRERGIKTVLITSAVPNEGKTFASCCLAGVLARDPGKRVLLIDADLRTGTASRALGISGDRTGLNDLLSEPGYNSYDPEGNAYSKAELVLDFPELVKATVTCVEVNLSFLPSGTNPDKPSQLFNVPKLETLIRDAERLFDWVIIDSPPVLALSDANLLAPLCDTTLVVVRSGKTSSSLIKDAISRIGPERICGLLMNRVRRTNSNYYAYYQRGSNQKRLNA